MNYCTRKQQIIVIVLGGIFITVMLVVPLIAYGFVALNSDSVYPKTKCHYDGYHIQDRSCGTRNLKYTGLLYYWFHPGNNSTIHRNTNIYCSNQKVFIINYFNSHYTNQTVWNCWYEKSNLLEGWVGFRAPYNVNGGGMLASGFIIFAVFVFMICSYLIIRRRNKGYHPIGSVNYGPL